MKDCNNKKTTYVKLYNASRKISLIAVLLMALTIGYGFTDAAEDKEIQTVFHVYAGGEYLGMVADKNSVEQAKEQAVEKAASEFKDLQLSIGTELSVVPEKVFSIGTSDSAVINKLEQTLSVEAEAVGISIDGETVLFVKDMDAYDEIIRHLYLQAVTETELKEFESRKTATEPLPELKEDETRLADIIFNKEVSPLKTKTAPETVLSTEDALTYLNKGTLEEKTYSVAPGDVLGSIASLHDMPTQTLMELNPGITEETILQIGNVLNVTVLAPFVEVQALYEKKTIEPIAFKKITEKDETQFKGEETLKQEGADGKKSVTRIIRKRNGEVIGGSVAEEHVITEPVHEVTVVGTKVIPSRGTGEFAWPADGGYISSQMGKRWGRVHQGIDIARPSTRSIFASDNGVVTQTGYHSTYGNRIVITHNNGYETLYAHLSSIDVKVGQTVPQGSKIGVMGSTGRSTGVHLHFEVFKNGSNIDPLSVLR